MLLDDCGNSSSRASALHGFIEASINLPSWVKILVTSRPEPDISESFSSVFDTWQLDTSNEEQRADVAVYIKCRIEALRQRKSLGNHWPGTEKTEDLITRADGLFISARLSLDLIEKQHRALDLILLEDDLSPGDRGQSEIRLDQLYCKILYRCQLSTDDLRHFPPRRPLIHSILELVIFAKVPISASCLFDLICNDIDDVNAVERVIDELAPVLQLEGSSTIRVIHSSFVDFLTSPGRSQKLCIATSKWHQLRFALTSLRVLNRDLQHDLCQIGDLSLLNAEVPDIEGKLHRESSLFIADSFGSSISWIVMNLMMKYFGNS
ncbi:hypothetical protein A0H81_01716 [Grifola frondosa]|uniref:NACHT domain-containing protein n=1 Tax=Grifola frondosa TaxID=5627 RepID=A0A1C7MTA0_GRIFR|nr:hypothetical protein A0H81_01716 [Grifola frondosa]